jgi:hypothetical protein
MLDGVEPQPQPTSRQAPNPQAPPEEAPHTLPLLSDGWRLCIGHVPNASTIYTWGALAESVGTEWTSPDGQPFTVRTPACMLLPLTHIPPLLNASSLSLSPLCRR